MWIANGYLVASVIMLQQNVNLCLLDLQKHKDVVISYGLSFAQGMPNA